MLIRKISAIVLLMLLAAAGCRHAGPLRPDFAPRPASFSPPEPESWILPNGLQVIFMENGELPLLSGSLFMKGGALWTSAAETGLAGVSGALMRTGGAGQLSADDLDRRLESLAASIGSSFGAEYGRVSFSCLSSDAEEVFGIFSDVVLRPRFEEERFQLWKRLALEEIRRRRDDADTVASIAFNQLLFGDGPYGRTLLSSHVRAMTREAVQAFHRRFAYPDGAILAVSGDINRRKLEELALRYFGSWPRREYRLQAYPLFEYKPSPAVYFIKQPFSQATVIMGQQGPARLSPDHVAIDLFNEYFGMGGFSSLLFRRVRDQLGLSYSLSGGLSPAAVKGKALIYLQSKGENAGQAMLECARLVKKMQDEEVPESELAGFRQSIENSFIFKFDTPGDIVERASIFRLLDYPPDYDRVYLPRMRAVTPAEVRQVARGHFDLGQFVVVVVGDESAYNSVQSALRDSPGVFGGPLRTAKFDEALKFN